MHHQANIVAANKLLLGWYNVVLTASLLAGFTILTSAMAVVFAKAEHTVRWPATTIFCLSVPVCGAPPP